MLRVEVKPELLRWAVERSRVDELELAVRFPQLDAWQSQERRPTLKQLETFSKATHTPLGFLLLPEPPVERLPIRDLRTVVRDPERPSADLLDTISVDGVQQATVDGRPLYYFSGDGMPGDVNGHGVGGVWFAVRPNGDPVS